MQKIPYSFSTFNITFPCAPENTDTLTQAALTEIKSVLKSGVSAEDLAKVKEQQKRKLEVDMKQNSFWMNNLYDAYFNGNDPKLILQKEKQINGLTSKMMQDVAKKYINPSKYIRAVLMPESAKDKPKKPF